MHQSVHLDQELCYLRVAVSDSTLSYSACCNQYINLRRSRDCLLLCSGGLVFGLDRCLFVSDPRFIQFSLGNCYAVHINALSI